VGLRRSAAGRSLQAGSAAAGRLDRAPHVRVKQRRGMGAGPAPTGKWGPAVSTPLIVFFIC